jgi:aminoglycoside phosphotransferase (APT) family kinase protein
MRNDIYYWKCDSPSTLEAKQKQFFKEKYASPEFLELAASCIVSWKGERPASLKGAGCDGNHFAFLVEMKNGERVFLRGDEGQDDDYMLAESAVMDVARAQGIPTPRTHSLSVGAPGAKVNFQILELIDRSPLDRYHKDGTLKLAEIARQIGGLLRKLHGIPTTRFGFLDTQRLKVDGSLHGLQANYASYFHTRLDEHLEYLGRTGLLDHPTLADLRSILRENEGALALEQGRLVHRDPALWNILGTATSVDALIDWDDAVSGDPADDLGMLLCFYDAPFMRPLLEGYAGHEALHAPFIRRIWLHMLRNMLWKAKLRHGMGYFEKGSSFFLNMPGQTASLRELTLGRIGAAMDFFKNDGRDVHGIL